MKLWNDMYLYHFYLTEHKTSNEAMKRLVSVSFLQQHLWTDMTGVRSIGMLTCFVLRSTGMLTCFVLRSTGMLTCFVFSRMVFCRRPRDKRASASSCLFEVRSRRRFISWRKHPTLNIVVIYYSKMGTTTNETITFFPPYKDRFCVAR